MAADAVVADVVFSTEFAPSTLHVKAMIVAPTQVAMIAAMAAS